MIILKACKSSFVASQITRMTKVSDCDELKAMLASDDLINAEDAEVETILGVWSSFQRWEWRKRKISKSCHVKGYWAKSKRKKKKTQETTKWVFNIYKAWARFRNTQLQTLSEEYPFVPVDELKTASPKEIDFWLTCFILEGNKGYWMPYPANSLYMIACSFWATFGTIWTVWCQYPG